MRGGVSGLKSLLGRLHFGEIGLCPVIAVAEFRLDAEHYPSSAYQLAEFFLPTVIDVAVGVPDDIIVVDVAVHQN